MRRWTLFAATALASVSLTLSIGCSLSGVLPSGVIEPSIVPSAGLQGTETIDRSFSFEAGRVRLQVPVDRAVYAGSEVASRSAIFIGGEPTSGWVPDYYRAFIAEKHQEGFYAALQSALHDVRSRAGLDGSRYVELVTSMVQELRYRTDPNNLAPKSPSRRSATATATATTRPCSLRRCCRATATTSPSSSSTRRSTSRWASGPPAWTTRGPATRTSR